LQQITNAAELVFCFREIDRSDVDVHGLPLPIVVRDIVTWASGVRAYLLFRDLAEGRVKGIVFHRAQGITPQVATMCQWCHRVRGNGGVKLLSVHVDERRTLGQYLCCDLACLSIDDQSDVDGLRETLNREARDARTRERIREFAATRVY
jgi:hypothetical protein